MVGALLVCSGSGTRAVAVDSMLIHDDLQLRCFPGFVFWVPSVFLFPMCPGVFSCFQLGVRIRG